MPFVRKVLRSPDGRRRVIIAVGNVDLTFALRRGKVRVVGRFIDGRYDPARMKVPAAGFLEARRRAAAILRGAEDHPLLPSLLPGAGAPPETPSL